MATTKTLTQQALESGLKPRQERGKTLTQQALDVGLQPTTTEEIPGVPLVPSRQDIAQPTEEPERKMGLLEKGARALAPKSVEQFAGTLGGALAVPGVVKQQEEILKGEMELHPQVLERLRDPNISREQKIKLARISGFSPDIISQIEATQKTGKEIAGEAVGTLGALAVGGAPGAGIRRGLAFGAGIGAGAGIKSGLDINATAEQIIKRGVVGSLVGLTTGAIFEGVGRLLSKTVGARPVREFIGRRFTGALKPKTTELSKELQNQLQFGWKTTGEKIAEAVDDTGQQIYKGGLRKMGTQSVNQINNKTSQLDTLLKQSPTKRVGKKEIEQGITESLEDSFGVLTNIQKKTITRELGKIKTKRGGLTLQQALKEKRRVDRDIPDGFWIEPNDQKSFLGHIRYNIRQNLRKTIETKSDSKQVRRINSELGLALDVKDLVGLRRASGQKAGTPTSISRILDSTIFSPAITTRVGQFIGRLGKRKETPSLRTFLTEKFGGQK